MRHNMQLLTKQMRSLGAKGAVDDSAGPATSGVTPDVAGPSENGTDLSSTAPKVCS